MGNRKEKRVKYPIRSEMRFTLSDGEIQLVVEVESGLTVFHLRDLRRAGDLKWIGTYCCVVDGQNFHHTAIVDLHQKTMEIIRQG